MFKKTTLNSTLPLFLLVFLYTFNACSSGTGDGSTSNSIFSQTPEHQEVAIAFANNFAKGKLNEAKNYATEASALLIELTGSLGGLDINPDANFSMVKDSIMGKKGLVKLIDNSKEKPLEEWYDVVMVDGEWKVNLDAMVTRESKLKAQKRKEAKRKRRAADQKATDKLFSTN